MADPVDDLRQRGNFEFSAGRYDAAFSFYSSALERDVRNVTLLCNRSASAFQMQDFETALDDASKAWEFSNHHNLKAAFRLAKCQLALQQFEAAKATIRSGKMICPDDDTTAKRSLDDLLEEVMSTQQMKEAEKPETSIREVSRPISIREFQKGETLGHGNFSEIVVVTHRKTNETFALKMITKKQAADLAKRQHPNVYNEIQMERRVLLERLRHPMIVRMYHAFQDYNTLYYLMDLHIDTPDLWSQLQWAVDEEIGGEIVTKKYMVGCHRSQAVRWIYQLLDALEHMHEHGIVHRDLKTENVLLDSRGHIVVIDFGTAKDLIQIDLNGPEFVGTPDFMSPEAVSGTSGMEEASIAVEKGEIGAQHTADLWALGAMLYIMQTGMTPFWCPSPYLAFLRIKRGHLKRPVGIVDDECWDLIQQLMKMDPNERLGSDAFKIKFSDETKKRGKRYIAKKDGGYDDIRRHAFFQGVHAIIDKTETVIPSLRDLCVRSLATSAYKESQDIDLCDNHPPGDGSRHDLTRLHDRDRDAVMHVLDRRKLLRDSRLYARFYKDEIAGRLNKVRVRTHDFVGQTRMNDDQAKAPNATMNDPHAKPIKMDDIEFVLISSPLFTEEKNRNCDESTRKAWTKLLKRAVATINRQRPKIVIAAGYFDDKSRKLLARINDSIPVAMHDCSSFFTLWMSGVQCLVLQSAELAENSEEVEWLREELEQCRMSKHPLFCVSDCDPRDLPVRIQKRLARGRVLCTAGPSKDTPFSCSIDYSANEHVPVGDDLSIQSDSSTEDTERDNFTMMLEGSSESGLRRFRIGETPDDWSSWYDVINEI